MIKNGEDGVRNETKENRKAGEKHGVRKEIYSLRHILSRDSLQPNIPNIQSKIQRSNARFKLRLSVPSGN